MSTVVNDVNGLSSNFANGDPALIDGAAETIFSNYLSMANQCFAKGPNVRVLVELTWTTPGFWGGSNQQTKTDKAAVALSTNQKFRDRGAANNLIIVDNSAINQPGALGDSVHTNSAGNRARAVNWAIGINTAIA